jgi:hypothetical protein
MKRLLALAMLAFAAITGTAAIMTVQPHHAEGAFIGSINEQQARRIAADWVRGPGFGTEWVTRSDLGPAADLTVGQVIDHTREAVLAVRGDPRYCGRILQPTWIVIFDSRNRGLERRLPGDDQRAHR